MIPVLKSRKLNYDIIKMNALGFRWLLAKDKNKVTKEKSKKKTIHDIQPLLGGCFSMVIKLSIFRHL